MLLFTCSPGNVLADDLPQPPYNGPNWTVHLDDPAGTVAEECVDERFYTRKLTDNVDEPAQQHHLLIQFYNLRASANVFNFKYKVKRPGAADKIKLVETIILPGSANAVLDPFIYDEREIFKDDSDTGNLKVKMRFGNNVGDLCFGIFLAEDPPCESDLGTPECLPVTDALDSDPPNPQDYVELTIEADNPAVPALSTGAHFLLGGLLIAAALKLKRVRVALPASYPPGGQHS